MRGRFFLSSVVGIVFMSVVLSSGCNELGRFQDASHNDCVAAFEHSLSIIAKEQEEDALVRELALLAVDWLAGQAGTKDRLVRQCEARATKYDTACILDANSSAELNRCDFFQKWD